MNALEQFYIDLDQSNWNVKQESVINQRLIKVNESLLTEGLLDLQHLAEVDRQAFHFSKSPEKRLSFRIAGNRKMKDGSEVPFEWPDIRYFSKEDFEYLSKRFKECKNIYAKTEYGLVLFYSKNKQENDFVIELLTVLFQLLKTYIEKARPKENKEHYILNARVVLANALYIANNRKESKEIKSIFKALIEYAFEVHQSWDVTHNSALRTIIDFTDFVIEYFKEFRQYVDIRASLKTPQR